MTSVRQAWGDTGREAVYEERSKPNYEELEDKYLQLKEEKLALKKQNAEYEDKLKKMATKLLRITADFKRLRAGGGGGAGAVAGAGKRRDVDTEDLIEDLRRKVRERDKKIETLQNRLSYFKHVQNTLTSKRRQFDHVKARVDTGGAQKKLYPMVYPGPRSPRRGARPRLGRAAENEEYYPEEVPIEDREEYQELQELVDELRKKLLDKDAECERLRLDLERAQRELERKGMSEAEWKAEAEVARRQQQTGAAWSRAPANDLENDLREKQAQISLLQKKHDALEYNFAAMKKNHQQLLEETEDLNSQYKKERRLRMETEHDTQRLQNALEQIKELNVIIDDLRAERKQLEEEHGNIMITALTGNKSKEEDLKRQMEAMTEDVKKAHASKKVALEESREALEKAAALTAEIQELQNQRRELEVKYYEQKQELELLSQKLKFFIGESGIDQKELEEALALIKRRREAGGAVEPGEYDGDKAAEELVDTRRANVDLANELERIQGLLRVQERIGDEYKATIEEKDRALRELERVMEEKRQLHARNMDSKQDRVRNLEGQLRGMVYGGVGQRALPALLEQTDKSKTDLKLRDGENAFEIRVASAALDGRVLALTEDAKTFVCAPGFFEHPIQSTPLVSGTRPKYNYTIAFVVEVDSFFLRYIRDKPLRLEVARAHGVDFHTIAYCEISIADVLQKGSSELPLEGKLVSMRDKSTEAGTLKCTVRMHSSISEAVKALREGEDLSATLPIGDAGVPQSTKKRRVQFDAAGPAKEVHITVTAVHGLKLLDEGRENRIYATYKFQHFPVHVTSQCSRDDEGGAIIGDTQIYPIAMNEDTTEYLKNANLAVAIMDDSTSDPEFYYGAAKIPLQRVLAGSVTDTYSIVDPENNAQGTVTVSMQLKDRGGEEAPAAPPAKSSTQYPPIDPTNNVAITVDRFVLEKTLLADPLTTKCETFVSYAFLPMDPPSGDDNEIETDGGRVDIQRGLVEIGQRHVFPIDKDTHSQSRWKLQRMLRDEDDIEFAVVADPDDTHNCVELGTASLSLSQIARQAVDAPDGVTLEVRDIETVLVGKLILHTTMVEGLRGVLDDSNAD